MGRRACAWLVRHLSSRSHGGFLEVEIGRLGAVRGEEPWANKWKVVGEE